MGLDLSESSRTCIGIVTEPPQSQKRKKINGRLRMEFLPHTGDRMVKRQAKRMQSLPLHAGLGAATVQRITHQRVPQ